MTELTLENAPRGARDMFNKGFSALERGNLDYAIDLLTHAVAEAPGLVRAWKFLRAAEIRRVRQRKTGHIGRAFSDAARMPGYVRAGSLLRNGKAERALLVAEKLLRDDPLNIRYVKLFCDIAVAMELHNVAILTFDALRENDPRDPEVLDGIGSLYLRVGKAREARECFEQLSAIRPNDGEVLKKLKDAMALDTMGGWDSAAERGATFHEMLKDEEEAVKLERQNKFVRSERDADALIEDLRGQIVNEPKNVNHYRQLSKLLVEMERFDEAAKTLRQAVDLNPGDSELDVALSRVRTQHYEHIVAKARESGDEAAVRTAEHDLTHFVFEDLQSRVERYPNDLGLRFDWGRTLFQNDYFNEAIQQFQMAQRNPRHHVRALYYMGLCFKAKGQYDMAIGQMEAAGADLTGMDLVKKDILYELGVLHELSGDKAKAGGYFKQIYQADIGYRDVAEKVEKVYT